MRNFWAFCGLLLLDALTTLIGLRLGGSETNLLVKLQMEAGGPISGLCTSRLFGLLIYSIAYFRKSLWLKRWLVRTAATVVVWNVFNICKALAQGYLAEM